MVMAKENDAPRKKRVRGSHRASVTRLISQLEEAIESDDPRQGECFSEARRRIDRSG